MALQKENPKFRLFKSYIIAFFWIGTAIFIDQITKYFAVAYLKNNHAKVLIDGVFELQYLENRGMAFGILQNKQFLFVVGALVICGAILLIYGRIPYTKKYMPLRICSILLIAGNKVGIFFQQFVEVFHKSSFPPCKNGTQLILCPVYPFSEEMSTAETEKDVPPR